MKHLLLLLPFCVIGYIFYMLYQQGIQIKAEEAREQKAYIKEANRKKGLQECLEKEDASVQMSIHSYCSVKGIIPTNCTVSQDEMNEIQNRVHENKQICYLKYAEE